MQKCEVCGSEVEVVGNVTKYYKPIDLSLNGEALISRPQRIERIDKIVRAAEKLALSWDEAFDNKALMRGFRKKVRRILNEK